MIGQTIGELLTDHVTLDIEGIDRLYLNAYQPRLQTGGGVAYFFHHHRGAAVASTMLMAPMSHDFVKAIETFAETAGIEVVHFLKHQSKDEETQRRLQAAPLLNEGVLYIGVAQEKFSTFRVSKKHNPLTGDSFPWLSRADVMCNQYYFYVVDEDFGPLFIKFSSYFPYTARINLNGHEYAKRQLAQAEFARTQVLDRPVAGRHLFEALIRENLDLGRPDRVSLIFQRRITQRTPGTFRTRIITQGVIPTLHVSYTLAIQDLRLFYNLKFQ